MQLFAMPFPVHHSKEGTHLLLTVIQQSLVLNMLLDLSRKGHFIIPLHRRQPSVIVLKQQHAYTYYTIQYYKVFTVGLKNSHKGIVGSATHQTKLIIVLLHVGFSDNSCFLHI